MVLMERRILQCDVPVVGPREVFRRALAIDFDTSTPAPAPLHPEQLHPEHSLVGTGVLASDGEQP